MSAPDPLNSLAEEISHFALSRASELGAGRESAAMACGFAGTKILSTLTDDATMRLQFAQIYSQAGLRAMADIVAGKNTPNQAMQ